MNWTALVLGLVALLPTLIGGTVWYRQNKRRRELDNVQAEVGIDQTKVKIEIDEATKNQLVQDAANANLRREQEREEWWARQVRTLREEIEDERTLSNKRFRRLNQIEEWAMLHVAWDRKAWARILESEADFPAPPYLPDEPHTPDVPVNQ